MTVIKSEDLSSIREKHKNQKIVFCSGSFDLTHAGHVLFFESCKNQGDILIVSVGRDESIRKRKGENRPILNQHVRLKTIDSLKPVDYCFLNPVSQEKKVQTTSIVFKELKPNIYAVNEDMFDIPRKKELCKKFNIEMIILNRYCPEEFDNISTTKIIDKIKTMD